MAYTFTEKKRIRKSFSSQSSSEPVPNLLEIRKASYRKLLQEGVTPLQRIDQGLQAAFKSVFPIESLTAPRRWTSSAIVWRLLVLTFASVNNAEWCTRPPFMQPFA